MLLKTAFEDLPSDLAQPLKQTDFYLRSYLAGVQFIVKDTARDPEYSTNHLLSYLAQDFIQSSLSILTLAMEGLQNVAKRELRFVLEASIKICFIQQQSYASSVADKLEKFDKELASQRISIKQNLRLSTLPERLHEDFTEEVGRIYGLTSNYVHLSPLQIKERISAVDAGRIVGDQTSDELNEMNLLVSRGLAASLVLLFHSVPDYVAGDWLVEADGQTIDWYFTGSRFIAGIDSHFDYKSERQASLAEIQSHREERVSF